MPNYRIELRSDTRTVPTPEMREAMARCAVGDEISHDDPTVNELEDLAAELFGKEAALLVTSGTMGNIVSLLTLSERGQAVICDPASHVAIGEAGGFASIAGCALIPVVTDGVLSADLVRAVVEPVTTHSMAPAVVWTENTHNRRGGVAWGPDVMTELAALASEFDLSIHIDGARIFNAAAAIDAGVDEIAHGADTVQFCLSKGLGAPFGSMIVGSRDLITSARRVRQMVGGGMRQAGVVAAAGIVALRDGPRLLAGDHRRAQRIAEVLEDVEGIGLEYPVRTNMVFLELDPAMLDAHRFVAAAARQGVGIGDARPGGIVRLVTHHQIDDADIEEAVDVLLAAAEAARVSSNGEAS